LGHLTREKAHDLRANRGGKKRRSRTARLFKKKEEIRAVERRELLSFGRKKSVGGAPRAFIRETEGLAYKSAATRSQGGEKQRRTRAMRKNREGEGVFIKSGGEKG